MTTYEKTNAKEATVPAEFKVGEETMSIQHMQDCVAVLNQLTLIRRDKFVQAIFDEKFVRAEENLKHFNLTQAGLNLMYQSITKATEREQAKKQAEAELAAKAAAEGTPVPTATSPAEAEEQNGLRLVKTEEEVATK